MILTSYELQDPLWLKLKEKYEARLSALRKDNDSEKLNEVETARLRGKIKEVKDFISMGDPKPPIEE